MTGLGYRVVDVFSDRPLAGNALCVVTDPCPEGLMAGIAREVNLSETTFPVVTGPGTYDVRIFTPGVELPFAGHPTLGTAWVLGPGAWTQRSAGATVAVEADATGCRMTQPPPVLNPVESDVAEGLGLDGAEGTWTGEAGGLRHVIVATDRPIDDLDPDLSRLARASLALGAATVAVVRRLDDATLHVRVFAPSSGVGEDPGTGSAAGPIAVLAHQQWGTATEVTIRQGDEIGRPCRIEVNLDGGGPVVGGRVTLCAEGRFAL